MDLEQEKINKVLKLYFSRYLSIYDEISLVLGELYRRVCKVVKNRIENNNTDFYTTVLRTNIDGIIATLNRISAIYETYITDRERLRNTQDCVYKNSSDMRELLELNELIPIFVKQLKEILKIDKIEIKFGFNKISGLNKPLTFNEFIHNNEFFSISYKDN